MCVFEVELSVGCVGAFGRSMLFLGKQPADFWGFSKVVSFYQAKSSFICSKKLYFLFGGFVCFLFALFFVYGIITV